MVVARPLPPCRADPRRRRPPGSRRPARPRAPRSPRRAGSRSGSRVVSFWSCMPGHISTCAQRFERFLPNDLMSSNAMPATSGMPRMREANSQYQAGLPSGANTNDRHDHHDEQEAGAAARVKAREALRVLGRQRQVGLVAGDRLVLGAVVLEHALEVRHARDQPQIADEDRDADQPSRSARTRSTFGIECLKRLVMPTGSRKKRPTAKSSENATVPAHAPLEICWSSSSAAGRWRRCRAPGSRSSATRRERPRRGPAAGDRSGGA